MRKLTHQEIVARQKQNVFSARLPVTVVLNNIRSLFNVGSIFRTADGAGVEKIFLCGITGAPPQSQISKTALGAELSLPWEHTRDTLGVIRRLREQGYHIVLLEQTDRSLAFEEYQPQFPVCLVWETRLKVLRKGLCLFAIRRLRSIWPGSRIR